MVHVLVNRRHLAGWVLLVPLVLASERPTRGEDPRPKVDRIRIDRHGDPLPDGAVARLGTVRLRRSSVSAFSPDGKSVVTHGYDQLRVWEVGTGRELKSIASKGGCCGLAVSPDGKMVAVSREAGIVIDVVDLAAGKVAHHFQTRESNGYRPPRTHTLVFSADGKRLSTSDDERGHVWDLTTGKAVSSFPHPADDKEQGVWIVAFSADGKLLATGTEGHKAVRVWDVATGKMVHELKGDARGIECAAFSTKGGVLAVGGGDKIIEVWDTATGKKRHTLRGTGDSIPALALSPDGSLLAAAANGGVSSTATGLQRIVLWNVAAEEVVATVAAPDVRTVQFSPDGKTLAWGSGEAVGFIDATTGKHAHGFAAHMGAVTAVAYSPDGKLIATGSEDGDVRLWNPDTGEAAGVLRGLKDHVFAVAFSPNGKSVAAGGRDHTTAVWSVATGKLTWAMGGHGNSVTTVAFSPDGKTVAAGGRAYQLVLRNAATGEELQTLQEERAVPAAVAFLPGGTHLVSGGSESVRVWDLKAGKVVKVFPSEGNDVRTLAVSPDGKLVVGSGAKQTQVWELDSGKVVAAFTGQHNGIGGVAFSPDGTRLASAGDGLWGGEKYNLHVRDTKIWKDVDLVRVPRDRFQCLAFSPDGKRLATGTVHAEVLIWDIKK